MYLVSVSRKNLPVSILRKEDTCASCAWLFLREGAVMADALRIAPEDERLRDNSDTFPSTATASRQNKPLVVTVGPALSVTKENPSFPTLLQENTWVMLHAQGFSLSLFVLGD